MQVESVAVAGARGREEIRLQYCEWHVTEAIKRRKMKMRYTVEGREGLMDMVHEWVRSPSCEALRKRTNKPCDALDETVFTYITSY